MAGLKVLVLVFGIFVFLGLELIFADWYYWSCPCPAECKHVAGSGCHNITCAPWAMCTCDCPGLDYYNELWNCPKCESPNDSCDHNIGCYCVPECNTATDCCELYDGSCGQTVYNRCGEPFYCGDCPVHNTLNVRAREGSTAITVSISGNPSNTGGQTDYTITFTDTPISTTLTAPTYYQNRAKFQEWTGDCSSKSGRSCTVSVSGGGTKTVTANYKDLCAGKTCGPYCSCSGGVCRRYTNGACDRSTGNCVYNISVVECCTRLECNPDYQECTGANNLIYKEHTFDCVSYACIHDQDDEDCSHYSWDCDEVPPNSENYQYRLHEGFCSASSGCYTNVTKTITDGDENEEACECITDGEGRYGIGGETAADECCGDDSNEYVTDYQRDDDAGEQLRKMPLTDSTSPSCCTAGNKCTFDNRCYTHNTLHNYNNGIKTATPATIFTNVYCNAGTWQGGDDSEEACDAIVGLNHWNLGGNAPRGATTCCEDDPNEHVIHCKVGLGNNQASC